MGTPGVVMGLALHIADYARQSSRRANKSEASTTTQHDANTERAWKLIAALPEAASLASSITSYEDLGISAFSGKERPDFERMLQDCRMGRINVIIVYYISRFSRLEPLDAIPIVTELLNLGVTIISVTEGEFRKGNLMDLIHIIMRLDAAHQESKNKSVGVLAAKRAAFALGGYVGGKAPYGFVLTPTPIHTADGKIIVVQQLAHIPAQVDTIRWVWETIKRHMTTPFESHMKAHPGSLSGIVKQMNADPARFPTKGALYGKETTGSAWANVTLKRVLRDPRIAGYAAEPMYRLKADGTQSTNVESYRIVRDPETHQPLTPYTPIIPPAEWHELQEWLDGRGRGKGTSRAVTLLSGMGILFCECGNTAAAHTNSYRCKRRKILPGQHAGESAISQAALDDYVAGRVFALISTAEEDPETSDTLAEATRRHAKRVESPELASTRSLVVAERADALQALEELYDERDAGGFRSTVGRTRFLKAERTLEERLDSAEVQLRALEAAELPKLPIQEWLNSDSTEGDPLGEGSWWAGVSMAERREFVRLFVDRVEFKKATRRVPKLSLEVLRERVSITWAQTQEVS